MYTLYIVIALLSLLELYLRGGGNQKHLFISSVNFLDPQTYKLLYFQILKHGLLALDLILTTYRRLCHGCYKLVFPYLSL